MLPLKVAWRHILPSSPSRQVCPLKSTPNLIPCPETSRLLEPFGCVPAVLWKGWLPESPSYFYLLLLEINFFNWYGQVDCYLNMSDNQNLMNDWNTQKWSQIYTVVVSKYNFTTKFEPHFSALPSANHLLEIIACACEEGVLWTKQHRSDWSFCIWNLLWSINEMATFSKKK